MRHPIGIVVDPNLPPDEARVISDRQTVRLTNISIPEVPPLVINFDIDPWKEAAYENGLTEPEKINAFIQEQYEKATTFFS